MELRDLQMDRLELNSSEDNVESASNVRRVVSPVGLGLAPESTFATQTVYDRPSAFIAALINALPPHERLTKEQTLFMAKFADACDRAYADMQKLPKERRAPTHILLLGQGGSGKTHVVQKLVFRATAFICPPRT